MKIFFIASFLATLSGLATSLTIPNADTPVFYLVTSSATSANLLVSTHFFIIDYFNSFLTLLD